MSQVCSENAFIYNFSNITSLPVDIVYQPWEWIIYQLIWPVIITFGLCNNALFIVTVQRTPSLHNPTYLYLSTLSISDISTLLCLIPLQVLGYYITPVRTSFPPNLLYTIVATLTTTFFILSIALVTLVTLERFLAICYTIKHHLMKGRERTVKLISIMVVVSLCISLTTIAYNEQQHACVIWPENDEFQNYPSNFVTQSIQEKYKTVFAIFHLICWLAMMIFNIVMFAMILNTLKKRKRNSNLGTTPHIEDQHRQVASMLVINGCVFFLCCSSQVLQLTVITIVDDYFAGQKFVIIYTIVVLILGINASINPTLYAITNTRYRQALFSTLKRCS